MENDDDAYDEDDPNDDRSIMKRLRKLMDAPLPKLPYHRVGLYLPDEEPDPETAQFHFLGSGDPLPVKDGKQVLRIGQQLLYLALRDHCQMNERQAIRIIRHLDYVPCRVLDLVAENIEECFSQYAQPTFTDVAQCCVAAGLMEKKLRWEMGK